MTSRQAQSDYARIAGPAVSKVGKAVRDGRLVKTACLDCGVDGPVQGHHHNGYEPEHALDVVWLCRPCHRLRHGRRGALPTWERVGMRKYMAETRGIGRVFYGELRYHSFTTTSTPKFLLKTLERVWDSFRTDEERAAAVALIERLAATTAPRDAE